jgi:hypothetical protein
LLTDNDAVALEVDGGDGRGVAREAGVELGECFLDLEYCLLALAMPRLPGATQSA